MVWMQLGSMNYKQCFWFFHSHLGENLIQDFEL